MTAWFTVSATCDVADAELVADLLWRAGPPAVEERAGTATDQVTLLAGYTDGEVAARTAHEVSATGRANAVVAPVTDDGLDAWRAHARAERAGRFVVVPPWLDHTPAPGEIVLRIDPARTFGSGSHPTTRLVLERLAQLDVAERKVLDVGCGSGVLSVAAAVVGGHVVGIDVDPAAREVVRSNARTNRVAERVHVDDRPLAGLAADAREGGLRFDLVLANLLSPIIVELADDLAAVTAPGGHLVVSGLLAGDHQRALEALLHAHDHYHAHDHDPTVVRFELLDRSDAEGWTVLTFVHRPADTPDTATRDRR